MHSTPWRRSRLGLVFLLNVSCLAGRDTAPHPSTSAPGAPAGAQNTNSTAPSDPNASDANLWPASGCPEGPFAQEVWLDTPTVKTAANKIDGADWSEGPVWLEQENILLFGAAKNADDDSQSKKTALYSFDPQTNFLALRVAPGLVRSNGLTTDPTNRLYAASHGPQGIVSFALSAPTDQTVVTSEYNSQSFDAPNDLVRHGSGGFFFTDTTYEQAGRPGQPTPGVYFVSPQKVVRAVDLSRDQPNGIALSPDQKTLYVGGLDKKLVAYPVSTDGTTQNGSPIATFDSNIDGMGVDCAGNIYLSLNDSKRIAVLSPTGDVLKTLALSFAPSNLAFGGPKKQTLFITGEGGLFYFSVLIPGMPS